MEEIIVFIFGLILGSFANLIIFRLHTGEKILFARSKCLNCRKTLKWFELIPVASFIFQKGRCRNCETRLSLQYPAVELLSGLLFLFIWLKFLTYSPEFFFSLAFWFFLLLASIYDLKHQILPEEFILSALILAISAKFFFFKDIFFPSFATGFAIFAFFVLLWFITKKQGIGFGDAKMALALGIFLGFPKAVFGLIFSFWLGALVGIYLILFKKAGMKTPIPFGPFLFLGNFIAFILNLPVVF
ncbi:MAG: hypothetical protein A3H02_01235 [Candidatus Niyogibacteria bacterium RIFCSPLOWO2_12_FULL_41_13]|uniref:Prepilin leader peptidase/N-methyltransferase n=1 Tax=Candidatus Niyogibacteria bacterium RIFCSPLOWO2_12_FULL_41_13 TaxID=1801726 RepID=A0A1G2F4H1_9BACT|nr:MAG: hypothetical protein A3H02_01235 [Candidatus Niyogibacteria bacterium RIFCSPLOWO2_12_FULL_41_13]